MALEVRSEGRGKSSPYNQTMLKADARPMIVGAGQAQGTVPTAPAFC
jgi:hypothetical protein